LQQQGIAAFQRAAAGVSQPASQPPGGDVPYLGAGLSARLAVITVIAAYGVIRL